jgi:hypothetical protein
MKIGVVAMRNASRSFPAGCQSLEFFVPEYLAKSADCTRERWVSTMEDIPTFCDAAD